MTIQSEAKKSAENKLNNYTQHQIYAGILLHSRVSPSPLINIVPVGETNREPVAATFPPQVLTCLSDFSQPLAAQSKGIFLVSVSPTTSPMPCSHCKQDGHNITTCPLRIQEELDKINELIDHLKAALAIAESQREATMKESKGVSKSTGPEWKIVDE